MSRYASLRDAWPAVGALSLALLVEMLDNAVLTVALPVIGRDLGAGPTDLQWVNGAYSLTFGGLLLVAGAVADRWGRRRVMVCGLAVFAVGSLGVLFVTRPGELIAVRAFTGIGAALLAPGTLSMSYRLFADDALRMRAISIVSTVGLLGMALGPTLGGLALEVMPWQGLLLLNVPVAALSIAGVLGGIPADTADGLHPAALDLPGAGLSVAALAGLLGGLGSGVERGWSATITVALLAGGVVAGVGFWVRECEAAEPMLDPALLRIRPVGGGIAVMAGLAVALGAVGFAQTLHMQLVWGWSPAQAGLGGLPRIVTLVAVTPLVEPVVTRLGRRRAGVLGGVMLTAGTLAYAAGARWGSVGWRSPSSCRRWE